jgi:hypothetical protein
LVCSRYRSGKHSHGDALQPLLDAGAIHVDRARLKAAEMGQGDIVANLVEAAQGSIDQQGTAPGYAARFNQYDVCASFLSKAPMQLLLYEQLTITTTCV